MMALSILRKVFALILLVAGLSACELADPDIGDNIPGISEFADDTKIYGTFTYGPGNCAVERFVEVKFQDGPSRMMTPIVETVYTDDNGFYEVLFEPGTKYAGETWWIEVWAPKEERKYFGDLVFEGEIIIGESKRVDIDL